MINRKTATQALVDRIGDDELVVGALGNTKYDLFNAKDRPRNFYLWNSMGMASSLGLGMAMAQPALKVIILQGDGGALMNMGSLATIANQAPANLVHIIWDNRMWQITGQQPTATAGKTDLSKIAEGAGYPHVARVETQQAFEGELETALTGRDGPYFIHALIDTQSGEKPRPHRSPTYIKHRFMEHLQVTH